MLNAELAGKKYPSAIYRVTAEAIQTYARATNDSNPALNSDDAVAPPVFPCVAGIDQLNEVMYDPELGVDMAMLVHARQEHWSYVPIRAGDELEVAAVLERVDLAATGHTFTVAFSLTNQKGELASEVRSLMFIRRTNTVKAPAIVAEKHDPVFEAPEDVAEDQPARYAEASGDHNPIHLDAGAAKEAGFPNVVLHGMCTLAFATKALVDNLAAGDPFRVSRVVAEFARPVFPGQSLVTRAWPLGSSDAMGGIHTYGFETVNSRGSAVLKAGGVDIVNSG